MLVAKNPSIPLVPNFPRGEENNGSERSPVRRRRAGQEDLSNQGALQELYKNNLTPLTRKSIAVMVFLLPSSYCSCSN
jgi:hypothetical protein